jgi:hypothetical protein
MTLFQPYFNTLWGLQLHKYESELGIDIQKKTKQEFQFYNHKNSVSLQSYELGRGCQVPGEDIDHSAP